MKKIYAVAAIAALGLALPAHAAIKDKDGTDKDRKVCRSYQLVGSRLPHRVCHTSAQWKQIDGAADQVRGENRRQIERNQNQIQHTGSG